MRHCAPRRALLMKNAAARHLFLLHNSEAAVRVSAKAIPPARDVFDCPRIETK